MSDAKGGKPRTKARTARKTSAPKKAAAPRKSAAEPGAEVAARTTGSVARPRRAHTALAFPQDIVEAIVAGRMDDPFAWLGSHEIDGIVRIAVFEPGADEASLIDGEGRDVADLDRVHEAGLFVSTFEHPVPQHTFEFRAGGESWRRHDAYAFLREGRDRWLGETDLWLLAEGRHLEMYDRLGAHPTSLDGVEGTAFAVWAPNARRVSVIGAFNMWDGRRHVMRRRFEAGVWEIFVPGVTKGELYKFEIVGAHGHLLPQKADPFAFHAERPPAQASVVQGPPPKPATPTQGPPLDIHSPVSIYEVHLGSWMRAEGESESGDASGRFLTYDELAEKLVPYALDMGFTHLEFMPVSEYPFSGSWGYQPVGLYAPTSRFGDPEGFRRLVDAAHEAGLGVILDWVPAHFPSDPHGLAQFDGTALYEHADPRLGFHKDWNTLIYNFGRREVANFLTANALYWLERCGVDGLRVDAVASMLYLDYSRQPGEWVPNVHGGRENLEAIALLREVNTQVGARCPGKATIAEESTAFPGVSAPVSGGGLGFHFKWNMGWMNDTLRFMAEDPVNRRYHHNLATFSLHYAWTEHFVLPLSHDEVVHGKGSMLEKMPGDRWQKFANLRAYYGYMWGHPGKTLLFMGLEFGQEREWSHDRSLDWHLLDDAHHRGVQSLVRDLNGLMRSNPALYALDSSPEGFEWIEGGDVDNSVLAFERRDGEGNSVVVVVNFTPVVRENYRLGFPQKGRWREQLNTDADVYGGSGVGNMGHVVADGEPSHGRPTSASLTLPPLATLFFVRAA